MYNSQHCSFVAIYGSSGGSRAIKRLAIIVFTFLAIIIPSYVLGDDEIRVLILVEEKGFGRAPEKGEQLDKVDDVDGRLILGYTSYEGKLSIWKGKGGLYLVNSLRLEDYVKGVVQAELGRQWAIEALKAQAVLVRTYVLRRAGTAKRSEFHVKSTVLDQVYQGLSTDPDIEKAVNSTLGEILTYKGKPIEAFYHSTSVGSTEVPENVFSNPLPYIPSVSASGRLSPSAFWNRRFPLATIETAAELRGLKDIMIKSRTSTGRVDEVSLVTAEGERIVKAKDLRRLMEWKIPSTDFNVYVEGSEAIFDGKGNGHGVGLCQWTALEMALDGKNYKDILSHFYPGTEITINEGI